MPDPVLHYEKKRLPALDRQMAYIDVGSGAPVVFLHGNPTSSYLWRNVISHLEGSYRCIAPDLIGMGDSDKLLESGPGAYSFADHALYLDAFFEALALPEPCTLVMHDWGSALGFDWANRHRDQATAFVYMEGIVQPVTWADWPEAARGIFQSLRSEAGEDMIMKRNLFVEAILPASIQRTLSDREMDEYRRPFAEPGEGRRPTLTWPRQIPIEGEPADVVAIVESYGKWLKDSGTPKLFVNAEPGAILTGPQREFCRSWANQQEVTVPGIHFIQEDSADEIGQAIVHWLANHAERR